MPAPNEFWAEKNLSQAQRDEAIALITLGETNANAVAVKYGTSRQNIVRWVRALPDDQKLMIAAKFKQERQLKDTRTAAQMLVSDGDDIDNDLRWIVKRLRTAIEACTDDDKLLELAQMREMRNSLMDLAKVRGMFNSKIDVQINLAESPQFIVLRQIMLKVLDAHPDAKLDFMREMRALNVIEGEVIEHDGA